MNGREEKVRSATVDEINEALISFNSGCNFEVLDVFGVHLENNKEGYTYVFRTYAPDAVRIELTGDFNSWGGEKMHRLNGHGVWEGRVVSDIPLDGTCYKYCVYTEDGFSLVSDIFAVYSLGLPRNDSIIYTSDEFVWHDDTWMCDRKKRDMMSEPMNIYKVELARFKSASGGYMNYRDISENLAEYVAEMGYTHIEFSSFVEQIDSVFGDGRDTLFSPPSRHGRPEDFKYLVEHLHLAGIAVLLDVFPPDRKSHNEISLGEESCILSSIYYWYEKYHIDGFVLCKNSKNNMAKLIPEDLEKKNSDAEELLSSLAEKIKKRLPSALLISDKCVSKNEASRESFDMYLNGNWGENIFEPEDAEQDVIKYKYGRLNYELMRSFESRYVLCFQASEMMREAYDGEMRGERLALIKLMYSYMILHPGKKLTVMGSEFGEENVRQAWDGFVGKYEGGRKLKKYICELNRFYLSESALWEQDFSWKGFEWISHAAENNGVMVFQRIGKKGNGVIAIINFEKENKDFELELCKECKELKIIFESEKGRHNASYEIVIAEHAGNGDALAKFMLEPLSVTVCKTLLCAEQEV